MARPAVLDDLAAQYEVETRRLSGVAAARKSTGSYYTPPELVECLLDSALQVLIDEAVTSPTPAARINRLMELTVCDPSCGAGAFLVAATRRISAALAGQACAWRLPGRRGPLGLPNPPVGMRLAALRAVTATLIHGVDLSESAAELCKVALWLQAFDLDRPNCYLDSKVRVGNALLGTTPALLAAGIPDAAFEALDGDDPKVVAGLRQRNRAEREADAAGQGGLF